MSPSSSRTRVPGLGGAGPGEQFPDLPEEAGDQGVVLDEVVDRRAELGRGGAECGQELAVLAGVMGMDRGAEAEAVAEQIRPAAVPASRWPAPPAASWRSDASRSRRAW